MVNLCHANTFHCSVSAIPMRTMVRNDASGTLANCAVQDISQCDAGHFIVRRRTFHGCVSRVAQNPKNGSLPNLPSLFASIKLKPSFPQKLSHRHRENRMRNLPSTLATNALLACSNSNALATSACTGRCGVTRLKIWPCNSSQNEYKNVAPSPLYCHQADSALLHAQCLQNCLLSK
jgi:hypothetical protein